METLIKQMVKEKLRGMLDPVVKKETAVNHRSAFDRAYDRLYPLCYQEVWDELLLTGVVGICDDEFMDCSKVEPLMGEEIVLPDENIKVKFSGSDAPPLTGKEINMLGKWIGDLYYRSEIKNAPGEAWALRDEKFCGLLHHPSNISYLGRLFGENPPEWYASKYFSLMNQSSKSQDEREKDVERESRT